VSVACADAADTLARIGERGHARFGYLVDARPFSFRNEDGVADGYAVALCQRIAQRIKAQLSQPQLIVEWAPVAFDNRLMPVARGDIDLLCAPVSATLARRETAAFSLPIFPSGNRAVLRADAPTALRDALSATPNTKAVWRGSPAAKVLEKTAFAVVAGTSTQSWLASRGAQLQIDARVVPVADYRAGVQQLLDRKVDVFFGDRTAVLRSLPAGALENIVILDRLFTHDPVALALARDDDNFRLLVDAALSETYPSQEFPAQYAKWFGEFDERTRLFFVWNTLAP
jgi:polar amino acid transport system substrate-binding protein